MQRTARENPQFLYEAARDETSALTEQIAKLEAEIDTRVAALYGLDIEDQRWAAKASPTVRPDDKNTLFFSILGGLKEHSAYFTHTAIQSAANDAELALQDGLNVYLTQAVKQGIIHDAGREWYSRLSEPVKLDVNACSKLVRLVETKFPLLDFTVWSTAQINPWMHHLLAKPVTFLHAPRETLGTIGETLREQGWEVALNPGKREAAKLVRPGDKMVVLRPLHSKQPRPTGRQMAVEQVLVELLDESTELSLMDSSEAEATFIRIASEGLIQIARVQHFAGFKRIQLPDFEQIN